jgi:hypothetical protein
VSTLRNFASQEPYQTASVEFDAYKIVDCVRNADWFTIARVTDKSRRARRTAGPYRRPRCLAHDAKPKH